MVVAATGLEAESSFLMSIIELIALSKWYGEVIGLNNVTTTVGRGITAPRTGLCGSTPCPPKTKDEWLSNMRVVFRIIQIEAEESVFTPLN